MDIYFLFVIGVIEGMLLAWGLRRILTPRLKAVKYYISFTLIYASIVFLRLLTDVYISLLLRILFTLLIFALLFTDRPLRRIIIFALVFLGMGVLDACVTISNQLLFGLPVEDLHKVSAYSIFLYVFFYALVAIYLIILSEIFHKSFHSLSPRHFLQLVFR